MVSPKDISEVVERWAGKGPWAVMGLVTLACAFAAGVLINQPKENHDYVRIGAVSVLVAIPAAFMTWVVLKAYKRIIDRKADLYFETQLAAIDLRPAPTTSLLSMRIFLRGAGKHYKDWTVSGAKVRVDFRPDRHNPLRKELVLPYVCVDANGDIGIECEWVLSQSDIDWLSQPVSRFCYLNLDQVVLDTNHGPYEGGEDRIAINVGHIGRWDTTSSPVYHMTGENP